MIFLVALIFCLFSCLDLRSVTETSTAFDGHSKTTFNPGKLSSQKSAVYGHTQTGMTSMTPVSGVSTYNYNMMSQLSPRGSTHTGNMNAHHLQPQAGIHEGTSMMSVVHDPTRMVSHYGESTMRGSQATITGQHMQPQAGIHEHPSMSVIHDPNREMSHYNESIGGQSMKAHEPQAGYNSSHAFTSQQSNASLFSQQQSRVKPQPLTIIRIKNGP